VTDKVNVADGRIGFVVNPSAGNGEGEIAKFVRKLLEMLRGKQIHLIAGTLESLLANELSVQATVLSPRGGPELQARSAAIQLLQGGIDVLIVIGGDGTLCDVASAIIETGAAVQLLGIGAGSANVGPLVSVLGRDIDRLSLDSLHESQIHGIDVCVSENLVGTAFNDVVLSNTYFGTRDGNRIDLDAVAKFSGEDRPAKPRSVCGPRTWIDKNNQRMLTNDTGTFEQIIASPINENAVYAGKAISGLMCWGPYLGNHGVLAAASTVMVRTQLELEDLRAAEPLHLAHISFGRDDQVTIGELLANAVLVIDGNPTSLLTPLDVVALRIRTNAIRVLRPLSFLRGLEPADPLQK
jgi:diacylglycerol kinase family enzyme